MNLDSGRQNIERNLRQAVFVEKYSEKYENSCAGAPAPKVPQQSTSFATYSSGLSNSDTNP